MNGTWNISGVCLLWALLGATGFFANAAGPPSVKLSGEIVDAQTGKLLPARLYIRTIEGQWHFAQPAAPQGSAVIYDKTRFKSVEKHTTLSAHPFTAQLPPGRYILRAERGKEYLPVVKSVTLGKEPASVRLELQRWIDMARRGWRSGDTHVHRTLEELPNVMLAEDLNVALPLTYWVTKSHISPVAGDKSSPAAVAAKPIYIDPTHVIYPLNTEYEIFTVGPKRHTLGAVFALGHQTPFEIGAPPVRPIAERAHRQGALLDLDKHSWPWSLMLVPVMDVDLFELANNHCWRVEFGFNQWASEYAADYMQLERDARGFTEWGWIDFGFQAYYTLLNCGFNLRPTAGTASGVHPVPLGFGRVYVHLPDGFSYEKWLAGLSAGRSFVTTGPMLFATVNGKSPGDRFTLKETKRVTVEGEAFSAIPLRAIEIVVNGQVAKKIEPANSPAQPAGYKSAFSASLELDGSSWIAARAFEKRPDNRVRFAHTGTVHVNVPGKPLRPRRAEVDYLIRRMQEELERNKDVLKPAELNEYRQALAKYQQLSETAQ